MTKAVLVVEDDRTIDSHLARLRKKIEDDPRQPRYIETVRGLGYRFAGGVEP